MRRRAGATLCALVMVGTVACAPPPSSDRSPYACRSMPVSLGVGQWVDAVSADGNIVVLRHWSDDESGMRYDVVDRRRGTRHEVVTTGPLGDGAEIHLDAAGTRIIGLRYPALAPGESRWFAHDIATRLTTPWDPPFGDDDEVTRFSADLTAAIVRDWTDPIAPRRQIDLSTGSAQDLADIDPGWVLSGFSPDLSLAVQRSGGTGEVKQVKVTDAMTGALVRDVGSIRNESRFATYVGFIDNSTLLVNNAVPLGSPSDGIDDDGAFVADIVTGAITRIDPGVPNASTSAATPDGSRSKFAVIHAQQSWIHLPPDPPQMIAPTFMTLANHDLDVVVSIQANEAWLHCY